MVETSSQVQSNAFPDLTIGKTYDLIFELGVLYYAITRDQWAAFMAVSSTHPTYDAADNVRVTLLQATPDEETRRLTLRVKTESYRPGFNEAGTISPYLVVASIALLLGIVSYFLLKEVREVVTVGGDAITKTGAAVSQSTLAIAIISVVVLSALYVAYRVWVRA
jgi:hypothetical protein